jgi:hypothetical protein
MFASPIMDFKQLYNSGTRIEDAINNGKLDKREGSLLLLRKLLEAQANIQANINAVQPNQYQYQHPP